jgi:DNA ligase-1
MYYSELCNTYEELEKNSSRLKKIEILSQFLNKIRHEKNKEIIYLLLGKVFPDYSQKEFGISEKLCIKALSKSSGITDKEIVNKWRKYGDLGLVSENVIWSKKQKVLFSHRLTTEKVLENLKRLPNLSGSGTIDRKLSIISELLTSASGIEAKYIIRTLLNDLRIGVSIGALRDAIVLACFKSDDKENIKIFQDLVQSSYDKSSNFKEVFEKACVGTESLKKVEIVPGKPLKVMLALKAKTIEEGFNKVGKPACFEYKYDGFRMLVHKDNKGNIKLFTRRLDDVTKQFPEVISYVKEIKADNFIIDCEAIGYDPKTKKYRPFQEISQRIKRKYDIEKTANNLPIEVNAFDILYLNNKSLIEEQFIKRTEILRKIINNKKYHLVSSKQLITSDEKEAENFYKEALKDNQEGLMIKNLNSVYKPGSRVGFMLKLKPSENEFDLIITGAEYGTGKRKGVLSSFRISCYDKKNNKFLEIGKASTGLKEKEEGLSFSELTEKLKPYIIEESGREVKIKPQIIVSVIYQNIQLSPTYESGFALRFPRIDRLRPDKGILDVASLDEIKKEYKKKEYGRKIVSG